MTYINFTYKIQGLAEFALSVVSTERSSSDMSSKRISLAGQGRPSDLKQGFHMALETAKEVVYTNYF